jgi:hypothetical protein
MNTSLATRGDLDRQHDGGLPQFDMSFPGATATRIIKEMLTTPDRQVAMDANKFILIATLSIE